MYTPVYGNSTLPRHSNAILLPRRQGKGYQVFVNLTMHIYHHFGEYQASMNLIFIDVSDTRWAYRAGPANGNNLPGYLLDFRPTNQTEFGVTLFIQIHHPFKTITYTHWWEMPQNVQAKKQIG